MPRFVLLRLGPLIAAFAATLAAFPARAGEPVISNVDVRGLRIGGVTTLTIDGAELGPETSLLLPFSARVELAPKAAANRVVFTVTLGADASPGLHLARVATPQGVSAPVALFVDELPQTLASQEITARPVALHGALGQGVLEKKLVGKAGEELALEVESQRQGGKLRPVLHVFNEQGLQLAWAWPAAALQGDARLTLKLPADGTYLVRLHDLEYNAPAPNHYRLLIGDRASLAGRYGQVFPLAVTRGLSGKIELWNDDGPAMVELPGQAATGHAALPWPGGRGGGLRPWVAITGSPELLEDGARPASDAAQPRELPTPQVSTAPRDLPAPPCAIHGRLAAAGEEDRYRLPVQAGAKYRFEVTSERRGAPVDAVLAIRNEQGAQLARGDDGPGTTDPVFEFTAPANTSTLVLGISDLHGGGGPRCVYRLAAVMTAPPPPGSATATSAANNASQSTASATTPPSGDGNNAGSPPGADFRLLLAGDRARVGAAGHALTPVIVERRGYTGAIRLSAGELPAGVSLENAEIPAGGEGVLLTLRHTPPPWLDAPPAPPGEPMYPRLAAAPAVTRLRGAASEAGLAAVAAMENHPLGALQPWLAEELAVAVVADSAFAVAWDLPADAALVLGARQSLPVKITRGAGSPTPARLNLLAAQFTPRVNGNPDQNKAIRENAKNVEIAADKNEGAFEIIVPPQLAAPAYDVALQAELLSANKQTVLAAGFTLVKRLPVLNPLKLELAGEPRFETTLDAKTGATVKIVGKLARRGGFTGEAKITLAGVPGGVKADPLTLKPETSEFELAVVFPANFAAGDVAGLTLRAQAVIDAKQANVQTNSEPVDVTIRVHAAPPPAK